MNEDITTNDWPLYDEQAAYSETNNFVWYS